jgi:WhiB family redox-sensing transcriptional regulator
MTERERRALLRRHPHVASWRKMFEAALKEKGADKVLVATR